MCYLLVLLILDVLLTCFVDSVRFQLPQYDCIIIAASNKLAVTSTRSTRGYPVRVAVGRSEQASPVINPPQLH